MTSRGAVHPLVLHHSKRTLVRRALAAGMVVTVAMLVAILLPVLGFGLPQQDGPLRMLWFFGVVWAGVLGLVFLMGLLQWFVRAREIRARLSRLRTSKGQTDRTIPLWAPMLLGLVVGFGPVALPVLFTAAAAVLVVAGLVAYVVFNFLGRRQSGPPSRWLTTLVQGERWLEAGDDDKASELLWRAYARMASESDFMDVLAALTRGALLHDDAAGARTFVDLAQEVAPMNPLTAQLDAETRLFEGMLRDDHVEALRAASELHQRRWLDLNYAAQAEALLAVLSRRAGDEQAYTVHRGNVDALRQPGVGSRWLDSLSALA